MKYSSIPAAQAVVEHCKARGITDVVISPGSRNAPLTIGFTQHSHFQCYSVVDERSAGFFALGMAQQKRKPVILVCTSGSAVLNYYPAVAEAFYSDIPLVILSADRPPYKIDIGDGQTIRQEGVLALHTGFSTSLKQDVVHASEAIFRSTGAARLNTPELEKSQSEINRYNENQLNLALQRCIMDNTPVHINCPFEEPLYDSVDSPWYHFRVEGFKEGEVAQPNLDRYKDLWDKAGRKMVLVGACYPLCLEESWCAALAEDPGVLVLKETTSNLHHPDFISSIDSLIAPIEISADAEVKFNELRPDVLITFGGMVVSKKVKAFLREYPPDEHWHIDPKKAMDTYYSLTSHIKSNPDAFFRAMYSTPARLNSTYKKRWMPVKELYEQKREAYLRQIPFSDFKVFDTVFSTIPEQYLIQLANSTTVRYSQLFPLPPSNEVYCNRGTSGIDGSVSTAVGASNAVANPTVFITGDLSVLYDSNGFWNENLRADFRVVVVNNQGGGIFRILPKAKGTAHFEQFFETVQHLDIQKLCALYGLEHRLASDEDSLQKALTNFYGPSSSPILLEIKTPRTLNDKILLAYFDFIS